MKTNKSYKKKFLPLSPNPKPKYEQDAYDKAFLKVLHELQSLGFAKNVKKLEEHLDITKNTLYQVRNGSRGVPKMYRERIKKFFVDRYGVNPKIFDQSTVNVFKQSPPVVSDVEEEYQVSNKKVTSGTLAELSKLKAENQLLKTKLEQRNEHAASKTSEAFVSTTMAFQEVVLELLAGLVGTSVEEVFAKVGNKLVEIQKAIAEGGNAYNSRIQRSAGASS